MNHLPPRPDPNEYDDLVIPAEHPEFSDIGRSPRFRSCLPAMVLFGIGFYTAAGFIWAFLKVGW